MRVHRRGRVRACPHKTIIMTSAHGRLTRVGVCSVIALALDGANWIVRCFCRVPCANSSRVCARARPRLEEDSNGEIRGNLSDFIIYTQINDIRP